MPIIKSAIKRAKQTVWKTERNKHFKTKMLTLCKNITKLVETWEKNKASEFISEAFSSIDTSCKRGLIHKNNANRKKSQLANLVWSTPASVKEKVKKPVAKKAPAKKAPVKKTVAKKTTTKKES